MDALEFSAHHFARVIGGAIVYNDDFEIGIILSVQGEQGLPERPFSTVGWNHNWKTQVYPFR
jgi:uncharacterized protein YjlB